MANTRRGFIGWTAAVGAGAAAFLGRVMDALADAVRKATPENILGPYYRKGAPETARLHGKDVKGTPLAIAGVVMGTDGKPLEGAMVDVWQADPVGRYDNDDQNRPPPANEFKFRAVIKTDKEGRYAFDTLVPGRYQIGRGQERPQHIHYMVTAPGTKRLVTQLYFETDPFFEGNVAKNLNKDPFVKFRELVIPLAKDGKTKGLAGKFDVVLAKA